MLLSARKRFFVFWDVRALGVRLAVIVCARPTRRCLPPSKRP